MKYGDRVSWTYARYLNSVSSTQITKYGTFQSLIKHTCRWKGKQLAMVLFDGNKRESKVPLNQLQRID
jgi:hypothetical protein